MEILDLSGTAAGAFGCHILSLLGHSVHRPAAASPASAGTNLVYHRQKATVSAEEAKGGQYDVVVIDDESASSFGEQLLGGGGRDCLRVRLFDVDGTVRATGFVLDHALGTSNELPAGDPYRTYQGPPLALPGCVTDHDVGVQLATSILAWVGHHGLLEVSAAQATLTTHRYSIDMPEVEPEAAATRTLNLVFPFAGVLQCADGWVEMAIITDATWHALSRWLGAPRWSLLPSFPMKEALDSDASIIQEDIKAWVRTQPVSELVKRAERDAVPVAEYKRIEVALGEESALKRGYSESVEGFHLPRLPFCPAPLLNAEPEPLTTVATRPLAGILVTDFTIAQAGAQASWVLAQLGATVVKVEHPNKPDIARSWSPKSFDASFAFLEPNAGKLGLAVRWDEPEGAHTVDALIARSHLFISNVRPDTLLKTGYTFDRVRRLNPSIAYVTISAEGTDNDHRRRPGWAPTFGAASGLGEAVSPEGAPPVELSQWADYAVGNMAALGAVQALRLARSTGEAVEVDTCAAAVLGVLASDTALRRQGGSLDRLGQGLLLVQDGYVAFQARTSGCSLPDTDFSRVEALEAVCELRKKGFAAAAVRGVDDVYAGRNGLGLEPFWRLDEHELLAVRRRTVRPPWTFNGQQVGSLRDAPWLGQHSDELTKELREDGSPSLLSKTLSSA